MVTGEGDVRFDERAKCANRGGGLLARLAKLRLQQLVALDCDRGEKRRAIGEVVVGGSRANAGGTRDFAQAHPGDAFGLDERDTRRDELLAQGAMVVTRPRFEHRHLPERNGLTRPGRWVYTV